MINQLFVFIFCLSLAQQVFSCPVGHWHLEDDYPPDYRFQILVDDPIRSPIQKRDFLKVTLAVYETYVAEFKLNKTRVDINHDWERPFFTAFAKKEGEKHFSINFWGGLARIPGMTNDALALVACHEIGHIWGAKPMIRINHLSWSSTEGQSDYFATGACLKRYFKNTTSAQYHHEIESEASAYTLCRVQYPDDLDFSVCLKSIEAAKSFGKVLNYLAQDDLRLDITTPSLQIIGQTLYNSYPTQQCRLDTLVNGSLCPQDEYPCLNGSGQRPKCWYSSP